ncbi:hypothetical protein DRN69_00075 [Candidatus Pacearchaeota archaeon]|nr:MAG: hypothetical protein DRN69_00075 [Candidatus Pacearchaeota archaeon]
MANVHSNSTKVSTKMTDAPTTSQENQTPTIDLTLFFKEKKNLLLTAKRILKFCKEKSDIFTENSVKVDYFQLVILEAHGIIKRIATGGNYSVWKLNVPIEELERAIRENEDEYEISEEELDKLFSPIIGYDTLKSIIKIALTSKKPIHILLVGPPASAKSLFLELISELPRSAYACGSRTTKSGIADVLMEMQPRHLIIDEFDKLNTVDYSILLSLCESQKLVIMMHNKRVNLDLPDTRVLAAANRIDKVPQEVLSRFEVLHLKEYTKEEFINVATKVLTMREGLDEKLARFIATEVAKKERDVRSAIRVARGCDGDIEKAKLLLRAREIYAKPS